MILDTNALSALLDKEAGLLEVIGEAPELALPVIVLGEYRFGVALSKRRAGEEGWLGRGVFLLRVCPASGGIMWHFAALGMWD